MVCHAAGVSAGWGGPAYETFSAWMLVPGQASVLVVPDARQDSRCCWGACDCLACKDGASTCWSVSGKIYATGNTVCRMDPPKRRSCVSFQLPLVQHEGPLRHLSLLPPCSCSAQASRSHSCQGLHEQSCLFHCRFADNKVVTGPPNIVFYAGAPLLSSCGYVIGAL